jgi:hypothetical protein
MVYNGFQPFAAFNFCAHYSTVEMFDVVKEPFGLSRQQKDMPYGEWKSSRKMWEERVKKYRQSDRFKDEPVPVWLD